MTKLQGCLGLLVLAVILAGAAVWATGAWLNNNSEQVAEAAVNASGIKDAVAKERAAQCQQAKLEAQRVWDRSVEDGDDEDAAQVMDAVDIEVKKYCGN